MSAANVGAMGVSSLLRRHVTRRPNVARVLGLSVVPFTGEPGQTKVENLDDSFGVTIRLDGLMSRWTMPCS